MSLMRRYPLAAFFVLAFALSWWSWILYSFDIVPTPIVGFGPFLAAVALVRGSSSAALPAARGSTAPGARTILDNCRSCSNIHTV